MELFGWRGLCIMIRGWCFGCWRLSKQRLEYRWQVKLRYLGIDSQTDTREIIWTKLDQIWVTQNNNALVLSTSNFISVRDYKTRAYTRRLYIWST
jgi:hypothetical protein